MAAAMVLGFFLSGALAAGPMAHMVIAEAKGSESTAGIPALAHA